MKSFTTSPSVRGVWLLAGGAAALLLSAGTASAVPGEQGTPHPVQPGAMPIAKGHEHGMRHHRHHAVWGTGGHLVRHHAHQVGHHHLTHHTGFVRLPFHPVRQHHHVHHLGRWSGLHHPHAAVMLPGQTARHH